MSLAPPSFPDLGHRFLIGLQPQPHLTDHDRRLLAALRPAGVVLFRANFAADDYSGWTATLRQLLADAAACIGRPSFIVAIDHEGGNVHRPPAPITRYPSAADWGDVAEGVGAAMGHELRSIGVNVNFAPVADVDSNPINPVIGARALGGTAELVSERAVAFARGLEGAGVKACAKHFPGHGDTGVDSHYELPILTLDRRALLARELRPFAALIEGGVDLVMSAHMLLPQLDCEPATLSRPILNDLLREELGFHGVSVSDDLGMGAISARLEKPETARLLLEAGCDLLCLCAYWTDTGRALTLARNMQAVIDEGGLAAAEALASARRVGALLDRLPMHDVTMLPESVLRRHADLAAQIHHSACATGGATLA